VRPFFFGTAAEPLFGVYHPAIGKPAPAPACLDEDFEFRPGAGFAGSRRPADNGHEVLGFPFPPRLRDETEGRRLPPVTPRMETRDV